MSGRDSAQEAPAWGHQQEQGLAAQRDRSLGFTARGDSKVLGDALPSPTLETDSGTTMEEREPPPRCGTGRGWGHGGDTAGHEDTGVTLQGMGTQG